MSKQSKLYYYKYFLCKFNILIELFTKISEVDIIKDFERTIFRNYKIQNVYKNSFLLKLSNLYLKIILFQLILFVKIVN